MANKDEVLSLYKNLSWTEKIYLDMRYSISPINSVKEEVPRAGKIYDIGCGAGLLSNAMALESGKRDVTGIDLSDEKIDLARRSLDGRKNIRFEKIDALDCDLDGADAVVACDIFHHLPPGRQEALAGKIHGSLKEGGLLIIQDIDKRPFHKYIFALVVDLLLHPAQKVYYRDSVQMAKMLEDKGFKVETRKMDRGRAISAVLFRCIKISEAS